MLIVIIKKILSFLARFAFGLGAAFVTGPLHIVISEWGKPPSNWQAFGFFVSSAIVAIVVSWSYHLSSLGVKET